MRISADWHIHSRNSCDEACMAMSDLMVEALSRGVRQFGVTDHIHTPFNLPDIVASRSEYLSVNPPEYFHFGVEVSCVSEWELGKIVEGGVKNPVYGIRVGGPAGASPAIAITGQDIETYGIEYVIGGTHWPLYVPLERNAVIRDYHRQNMFLVQHPLVDIVAHPWWWMGHWEGPGGEYHAEPWFDDFEHIPQSIHDEFAAAAVQFDKRVEVNIEAHLLNPLYPDNYKAQYLDYLAGLAERGVRLSMGSDCHSEHYDIDLETAERMLESVGIKECMFEDSVPRRPRSPNTL